MFSSLLAATLLLINAVSKVITHMLLAISAPAEHHVTNTGIQMCVKSSTKTTLSHLYVTSFDTWRHHHD